MTFSKYVAWLGGQSVAVGTRSAVEARAREIADSEAYRAFGYDKNGETVLRITNGARQLFVASYILHK